MEARGHQARGRVPGEMQPLQEMLPKAEQEGERHPGFSTQVSPTSSWTQ